MAGDFVEKIDGLIAKVHGGHLKATVKVDQIYAHYQHEGLDFHHPDGGEALYLTTPLFAKMTSYMQRLADKAITADGTDIRQAMIDNAEDLSMEVYQRAPWEFGDLRGSGHPTVTLGEGVIYDRAPNVHRLSDEELRIKSHLRYLFDPHRYAR